jgi:hypothetical protein
VLGQNWPPNAGRSERFKFVGKMKENADPEQLQSTWCIL